MKVSDTINKLKKDVFGTIEKMSIEDLVNIINITTDHYYKKGTIDR